MNKNDGGPAFPSDKLRGTDNGHNLGLTVRDYFAAAALTGFISNALYAKVSPEHGVSRWYSEQAYEIADAMISARSK